MSTSIVQQALDKTMNQSVQGGVTAASLLTTIGPGRDDRRDPRRRVGRAPDVPRRREALVPQGLK
jgi:hypothetical protein